MNRDDIVKIFENAEPEQIRQILALAEAEVKRAQADSASQLQTELKEVRARLLRAQETIRALEAGAGDVDKLRSEIEAYKWNEARRLEKERAAAARAELMERLDAVLAGRSFVHERMRELIAADFERALADKENRGKTDAAIFEALTRGRGYFASQNPAPADMGAFGAIDGGRSRLSALRAAMDLPPEM